MQDKIWETSYGARPVSDVNTDHINRCIALIESERYTARGGAGITWRACGWSW